MHAGAVRRESDALHVRDTADAVRTIAPLVRAADAVALDTKGLSFEEQVNAIVHLTRKAFS